MSQGPAYTLSPEPMTDDPQLDAQGRPRSVWSALLTLDRSSYRQLVRCAFPEGDKGEESLVLADAILHEAVTTRRWEQGQGHWQVWIDAQGRAKVQVWP